MLPSLSKDVVDLDAVAALHVIIDHPNRRDLQQAREDRSKQARIPNSALLHIHYHLATTLLLVELPRSCCFEDRIQSHEIRHANDDVVSTEISAIMLELLTAAPPAPE